MQKWHNITIEGILNKETNMYTYHFQNKYLSITSEQTCTASGCLDPLCLATGNCRENKFSNPGMALLSCDENSYKFRLMLESMQHVKKWMQCAQHLICGYDLHGNTMQDCLSWTPHNVKNILGHLTRLCLGLIAHWCISYVCKENWLTTLQLYALLSSCSLILSSVNFWAKYFLGYSAHKMIRWLEYLKTYL